MSDTGCSFFMRLAIYLQVIAPFISSIVKNMTAKNLKSRTGLNTSNSMTHRCHSSNRQECPIIIAYFYYPPGLEDCLLFICLQFKSNAYHAILFHGWVGMGKWLICWQFSVIEGSVSQWHSLTEGFTFQIS